MPNKLKPLFRSLIVSTIILLSFQVQGQNQDPWYDLVIGPHLTFGYENRFDNYFNLGLAFPIYKNETAPFFRLKPSVSFGSNQLYGLAFSWYPFLNENNKDYPEGVWFMPILMSHFGGRGLLSSTDNSIAFEPFYTLSFFVIDVEFGYAFLIEGTDPNLDNRFKIGVNINLSRYMFSKKNKN